MKTRNAKESAMPTFSQVGMDCRLTGGLTKREYFAGLAMQGLLTCTMDTDCTIPELCADAVTAADALLKELEK